ncbi:MAG: glycoside hydrolase family 2 protein [Gemmatimonadota bacterium]|nr:glycoside hydrolase family 2 protein [Gemmatimonadota bacterium]
MRPGCATLSVATIVLLACSPTSTPELQQLHDGWQFREAGGSEWHAASVPGSIHLDLFAAGVIGDPYYRDNEFRQQWIERKNWEYRMTFDVSERQLQHTHHDLIFEGLDTYARVELNDVVILESDNMFRRFEADVASLLRPGPNRLSVFFQSPIDVALPKMRALGYELPQGNDRSATPTRAFTRKAAYHYGWDWGPRFVTSGIWRPILLRSWSGVAISDMRVVQQELNDERAVLSVVAELLTDSAQTGSIVVRGGNRWFAPVEADIVLEPGLNVIPLEAIIDAPQRWWPHGLGKQPLYQVVVEVQTDRTSDRATRRIGLRDLSIVTDPDTIGRSFYVRVNGVPVFMKGANYVPLDHFPSRVPAARYRKLFDDVTAANMNMLRVWGGGIYEHDLFYDLADENGVLIWQDFMFANAMYPGDSAFVASVRAEAADNIKRLRHHPSIALWCGNNEIDEGWRNWGWQVPYSDAQATSIRGSYERVFHDVLPAIVTAVDPGRFYWPSSPSHGWGRAESMTEGDAHYWGIWHGGEPFEMFQERVPRFMSEFGFQGYPSLETVHAFTAPRDRALTSRVMQAHQKAGGALERIDPYLSDWYRPPRDFVSFLYVSQLLQAEGIAMALESHRRAMPRTMGTLYWQLNDTWPVASWSSLDYFGTWKALHYYTARAFADVVVSPVVRDDTLEVHIVSDRLTAIAGDLSLTVLDFQGAERWSLSLPVGIEANRSTRVLATPVSWVLADADPTEVVLRATFSREREVLAQSLMYFVKPKDLALPPAEFDLRVLRDNSGHRVVLEAKSLLKNVYLTADGLRAHFSDNFFDMLPGEVKQVQVQLERDNVDLSRFVGARTLRDSY